MNEDEKRKLLDQIIDWMWEQYLNSGYPENPEMNFRKYCDMIGKSLLPYRNRKDDY